MSRKKARIDEGLSRPEELSRSVEVMLSEIATPVELLRDLISNGASNFGTPDGRRDEVNAALLDVAKAVRQAKSGALQWVPRAEHRAAGPIELSRMERVEDFLGSLDGFCSWARKMSGQSGSTSFDTEWRKLLIDAYEIVLHACRGMRRAVEMGI